jgi:hypothetical protein
LGRRLELWLRLRRELLGPAEVDESLRPGDVPRDLYMTGILAPADADELDIPAAELLGEAPSEVPGDAEDEEAAILVAPTGAAYLDPKALPHSFGLSFRVAAGSVADIAITWGDYLQAGDHWERIPQRWIERGLDLAMPRSIDREGLRFHVISDPGSPGRVSLYLENLRSGESRDSSTHAFQPQIRVVIATGGLLPVEDQRQLGGEDPATQLLYRYARPYARGHMTSAMWRSVDPERGMTPEQLHAFWPDVVQDAALAGFAAPDVRTEFLPATEVPTPTFEWTGPEIPELSAGALSGFDEGDLRDRLAPLAAGYRRWVAGRRDAMGVEVEPEHLEAAAYNLAQCDRIADRIAEGIDLIARDRDSRLAFGFAMQAIERQSAWQGRPGFEWRPFQLAFILLALPSVGDAAHEDRAVCDLLWFATGGGKTEAYLALVAFAAALSRLRAADTSPGLRSGHGTVVLTRYTLRLLTLQQFRRTARLVTACELLRVTAGGGGRTHGWRPRWYREPADWLWGTSRFSVGLWVGGQVTPNRLEDYTYPRRIPGALSLLREGRGDRTQGEPAQMVRCPACDAWLAVPEKGLPVGQRIHLIYQGAGSLGAPVVEDGGFATLVRDEPFGRPGWRRLTVSFPAARTEVEIMGWWRTVAAATGARIGAASAVRPGYFFRVAMISNTPRPIDFDVFCVAPGCPLAREGFKEQVPVSLESRRAPAHGPFEWQMVPDPFRDNADSARATRVPIPILTVDDQVYQRLPTVLVATVDKFASLPFDPKAGAIFGNVDRYHARQGFYRSSAVTPQAAGLARSVAPVQPPSLVLQDELHLIEGPLGSLAGLSETAISALLGGRQKYIASTATIAAAPDQILSLFQREASVFPQPGLAIGDTFWSTLPPSDAFAEGRPGRLYLGYTSPGRGPQTPLIRLISSLMQEAQIAEDAGATEAERDPFTTVVGYFNAVRELAGAVALARQDVRQWMQDRYATPRQYDDPMNLSSQAESTRLPLLLEELAQRGGDAVPLVVATSMFGTGVDVPRLGLMFVNGQPKTTAAYVQATGRVGRETGGLVVTFMRAARPRDLDHYEYFAAYHSTLSRSVEAISVAPFAPRARERLLGPLMVALLRQSRELGGVSPAPWVGDPNRILAQRVSPETAAVIEMLRVRAAGQPPARRPDPNDVATEAEAALDRWVSVAQRAADVGLALAYVEYSMSTTPVRAVVLGDLHHEVFLLPVAFRRVSQSMRDVESQTRFGLPP